MARSIASTLGDANTQVRRRFCLGLGGALGGIRTPNLLIRSQHIPIDTSGHERAGVSPARSLEDSSDIVCHQFMPKSMPTAGLTSVDPGLTSVARQLLDVGGLQVRPVG